MLPKPHSPPVALKGQRTLTSWAHPIAERFPPLRRARCLGRVLVGVLVAGASCLGGGDDFPPPRLSGAVPAAGSPGQAIMLVGDHFCAIPDDHDADDPVPVACDAMAGNVLFGTDQAVSSGWTMTSIGVAVPPYTPPGRVSVRVAVAGRTSNAITFVVTP